MREPHRFVFDSYLQPNFSLWLIKYDFAFFFFFHHFYLIFKNKKDRPACADSDLLIAPFLVLVIIYKNYKNYFFLFLIFSYTAI